MIKALWKPIDLTERQLIWRLVCTAAVIAALVGMVLQIGIDRSFSNVKKSELEVVMTAVEAGPLQLARYHSTDLASKALADLFTRSGLSSRNFVSAVIAAEGPNPIIYATWRQDKELSAGCLATETRSYRFEDAFEPFRATVTYDSCKQIPSQILLGWIIAAVGLLSLVLAFMGVIIACRPVFTSLKAATRIFERQGHAQDDTKKVTYLPLRHLVQKALDSRKFEREAALMRAAQDVSHDLANPIVVFDYALRAQNWDAFLRLKGPMARSLMTIRSILAGLSNSSASHVLAPVEVEVDVKTLVDDFVQTHPELNSKLDYEGPDKFAAFLDLAAFERSVGNLIKNAVEAGATNVHVRIEPASQDLVLIVEDDGPGVPQLIVDRLFQRGATYGKSSGSGIGLHNVKSMAEGHGGTVDHQRIKGRTAFTIKLPNTLVPMRGRDAIDVPTEAEANATALPNTILIALPNSQRQAAFCKGLNHLGMRVVTEAAALDDVALIYAELDSVPEHFLNSGHRLVFDDEDQSVDASVKKIIRIFDAMLKDKNGVTST